jgi:hypothetical protein
MGRVFIVTRLDSLDWPVATRNAALALAQVVGTK